MRQRLLAATALALAGFPSIAVAADDKKPSPIQVTVNGYFEAFLVYAHQSDGNGPDDLSGTADDAPGANRRSHKVSREAEIHFNGSTVLDNGLKVGIHVEFEAETRADQVDESFMYFDSAQYGRLDIGSTNSAPYKMAVIPPSALPGHGFSDPRMGEYNVANVAGLGGNALGTTVPLVQNLVSGDAEKLTYYTPRVFGFQVGLSYTPDNCEENNTGGSALVGAQLACGGSFAGLQPSNNAGQQSEIIEVGANYIGNFSGVDVMVSGGYSHGNIKAAPAGAKDWQEWTTGAKLGYAGFQVGGAYHSSNQGLSGHNDREDYAVSVAYSTGPWMGSLGYGHGSLEAGAATGEDRQGFWEGAVNYQLGPGIKLAGGVQYWRIRDNLSAVSAENNALVFLVGTELTF